VQNASGFQTIRRPQVGKTQSQFADMPIPALDKTDLALLALLRDDARAPTAELARKLKLSRTTVQSRMERLERQRVIAGYTVVVPDELEAGLVRAHVLITLAPKRSGAIEVALRKIAEVRVLHSVSGPFDLIAIVAAASIGELDALIDRIGSLDGVERTTSAIVLSTRIQR
jgi:DNA-binding Lrp family transcriptional regulator